MERHMPRQRSVPPRSEDVSTIWEVSEDLWARLAPVVAEVDAPKPTGRPCIDRRAPLNAILFRLRSGCWVEPAAATRSRRPLGTPRLQALGAPRPVRTHASHCMRPTHLPADTPRCQRSRLSVLDWRGWSVSCR
jgi:hypothetical protein